MKIIQLQAENIKKLVAVSIKPDGNMVEITGSNGQGKTSVLDSILWALKGSSKIQTMPIRNGVEEARIRLDLGELIVTRKFKKDKEGETTSSLTVESGDGARFPSPQAMLDGLLGELAFDPLAFARMKAREQFDQLKRFVPGVDFEKIDNLNRADFEKRREIRRQAKLDRAASDKIVAAEVAAVDETAIFEEVRKASDHNGEIENRKIRREQAANEITRLQASVKQNREEIESIKRTIAGEEDKINDLQTKLAQAGELPAPIDVNAIQAKLVEAKKTNAQAAEFKKKIDYSKQADELDRAAVEITNRMETREIEKRAAIEKAKLPVAGLGFGDGIVTMNGVPFDQASGAEQLRTSIAIAMSLNPKLRVIRVSDGSLLDEKSLKMLAEMANAADYQVWIERVDGSGKVGFVLEDGHIKKAEAVAA